MQTFTQFASANIRIDEDANGLLALVPDQSGEWMTVRCMESKTNVYANHCFCRTIKQKQHCNHVELVQAYWNRIYKPVVEAPVETPKVVKARKPRAKSQALVRKQRNGGLVLVKQPAKVIELPISNKVTDISTRGNFGTKAFSIMR